MVAETNWRNASYYQYLHDLNPAELAWEFLRRNSEYEQEVAASDPADERAATALTARWGLRFPNRAEPAGGRRGDLLEPSRRPGIVNSCATDILHDDNRNHHNRSGQHQSS